MNKPIVGILKLYKKFASPVLEKIFGKACRFTPTCGEYIILALDKFGTRKGLTMGIKRLARCHPWGGSGYDPVPDLSSN
jgi:putative membrane protein insertion efficiency factor